MSHFIRPIQLKRTIVPQNVQLSSLNIRLKHGEPLFIKKVADASGGEPKYYLAVGDDADEVQSAKDAPMFRAYSSTKASDIIFGTAVSTVQYSGGNIKQLYDDNGGNVLPITLASAVFYTADEGTTYVDAQTKLAGIDATLYTATTGLVDKVTALETVVGTTGVTKVNSTTATADKNYYLLARLATSENDTTIYDGQPSTRTEASTGIYFNGSTGALMSAAWNSDLAERRPASAGELFTAGDCVVDTNSGVLYHSFEDLQPNAHIISDSYGFCMGPEDGGEAIALCGQVLAKCITEPSKLEIGDCLCATVCGKLRKMTRREIRKYPDRIVGTFIRVPKEDKWMGHYTYGKILINIK